MTDCTIGKIIGHKAPQGIGFKITFTGTDDKQKAQHYKDMITWILQGEYDLNITKETDGYYDRGARA